MMSGREIAAMSVTSVAGETHFSTLKVRDKTLPDTIRVELWRRVRDWGGEAFNLR